MLKNERILITGGAGFVGHHFVEHFLKNTEAHIVVLDKLSYASSGLDRLRDIGVYREDRVTILGHDLSLPISEGIEREIGDVRYIFHLAAESHVDRSIDDPMPFIVSNVVGTAHILNFARKCKNLKQFFYFGTDEVFGPAPSKEIMPLGFREDDRHNPANPYAATKSGGEMLVLAYKNTYRLPATITRSMNIFGERQHPEKYIPMCIKKILAGERITVHANKTRDKAGSRFYIHARNVADGYLHLVTMLEEGKALNSPSYNITGEQEMDNLELARRIAHILNKTLQYEMVDFHSSRPGHDLRYALDGRLMKSIGWEPNRDFENSLRKTVEWVIDPVNSKWMN